MRISYKLSAAFGPWQIPKMITMLLNRAAMVESLLWFPVPFRKVCLRWALEIDLNMKQLRMKRRRRGKRPITETDRRLCIKSFVFRFTYAVRYNVNHVIRISSHSCPGPEILVRNLKKSILIGYIKSILNEIGSNKVVSFFLYQTLYNYVFDPQIITLFV